MAKPGTILESDKRLLVDALAALGKGKTHVVEDHLWKVIVNMEKADSYVMPKKINVRNKD